MLTSLVWGVYPKLKMQPESRLVDPPDKVTTVQNDLSILMSQIVDCLGDYPRKADRVYSTNYDTKQVENLAHETVDHFLTCFQNFRKSAQNLSTLVDTQAQLERIRFLNEEMHRTDEEIKQTFEEIHKLKDKLTEDFTNATESYLSSET